MVCENCASCHPSENPCETEKKRLKLLLCFAPTLQLGSRNLAEESLPYRRSSKKLVKTSFDINCLYVCLCVRVLVLVEKYSLYFFPLPFLTNWLAGREKVDERERKIEKCKKVKKQKNTKVEKCVSRLSLGVCVCVGRSVIKRKI